MVADEGIAGAWERAERAERRRIWRHLLGAEQLVRSRDDSSLSSERRRRRARHATRLRAYRERGVYPRNPDFARRTPYFVDGRGVCCALAALIEASGERGLVDRVARLRNHALVRELADSAELVAWLDETGLTLDEAARIQPSYEAWPRHTCICTPSGAKTLIDGRRVQDDGGVASSITLRVDALYGDPGGLSVGGEVRVNQANGPVGPAGERHLAAIGFSNTYLLAWVKNDGTIECRYGFSMPPECPLDDLVARAELVIDGFQSPDCALHAAAVDERWLWPSNVCTEPPPGSFDAAGGTGGSAVVDAGGGGTGTGGTSGTGGAPGAIGSSGTVGSSTPKQVAESEDSGGCSTNPTGADGSLLVAATVAVAGVIRRRRRARRDAY